MGELDHWHPVMRSGELGKKPAAANLAGQEIVVFRTDDGRLGALADRCPHRGMRLSLGAVEGAQLVCPYHGWRWAPDGQGRSPATPAAKPCARHYDIVERMGALWVKRAESTAKFPTVDVTGWTDLGCMRFRARVPLELVLDNFTEVEHTPTTHTLLGYPIDRMAEVETQTTIGDEAIRVYNIGPQRRMPPGLTTLYGIPRPALFVDDWTTYFSPIYTVYDQYWLDPQTRDRRGLELRIAVFFNPISAAETEVLVFPFARTGSSKNVGMNAVTRLLTSAFTAFEIFLDCRMLSRLADKSTSLQGNSLSRFDKPLVAARHRIERLYRGRPHGALPVVAGES